MPEDSEINILDIVSLINSPNSPFDPDNAGDVQSIEEVVNLSLQDSWTEEDWANYYASAANIYGTEDNVNPSSPESGYNPGTGRYEYTDEDFEDTQLSFDYDWATSDLESFLEYSYGINNPDELISKGIFTAYDNTADIFAADAFNRGSQEAEDSLDATMTSKGMEAQRTMQDLFSKDTLNRFRGGSIALGSGLTGEIDDAASIIDAYRESQEAAFSNYENKMNSEYGVYDKSIYNSRLDWLAGIAQTFSTLNPETDYNISNIVAAGPDQLVNLISQDQGYEDFDIMTQEWGDYIANNNISLDGSEITTNDITGKRTVNIDRSWYDSGQGEISVDYDENFYLWEKAGKPEEMVVKIGGTDFKVKPSFKARIYSTRTGQDTRSSSVAGYSINFKIIGTVD